MTARCAEASSRRHCQAAFCRNVDALCRPAKRVSLPKALSSGRTPPRPRRSAGEGISIMRQTFILTVALCLAQLAAVHSASAAFPDRPVRLIVTSPPGGPPDIMARLLSDEISKALGQPLVVENRVGGAGGIIGSKF